jgi:ADP-ribosyl-[dinitrogen reductase] hydrolase
VAKRRGQGPALAELVATDKVRGCLLGLVAGEALGLPVAGLDRDTILRRHRRVVRPLAPGVTGELGGAALALAVALAGGEAAGGEAAEAEPRRRLGRSAILALAGRPGAAGATAGEAAMATALDLALATDPYRRLPAATLLLAVEGQGSLPAAVCARLAEDCRSPPAPDHAVAPYAALLDRPDLLEVALALHALLVRPRSAAEAVVYAVNLGGDTALRGALVGAVAGAHRGAAALPRPWLGALPPLGGLDEAVAALGRHRLPRL